MWLTGLVLLAFILFHLAHYTFGIVHKAEAQWDGKGNPTLFRAEKNYLELVEKPSSPSAHGAERQDVYSMMVNGFRTPWISITYLMAMAFLMLHLRHGGSSMFQSLGMDRKSLAGGVALVGPVLGIALATGNCAIVLAVWLGAVA